jgi:hypothetical protein
MLTGQVYFPNALSAHLTGARPNDARPLPDQSNETDLQFNEGQRESGGIILAMEEGADGVTGSLLIAVDSTDAAARRAEGLWRRPFGGRLSIQVTWVATGLASANVARMDVWCTSAESRSRSRSRSRPDRYFGPVCETNRKSKTRSDFIGCRSYAARARRSGRR